MSVSSQRKQQFMTSKPVKSFVIKNLDNFSKQPIDNQEIVE